MIEDCDSAIIIWVNQSSVIAENLERLKRLGKPTFVYECSTKSGEDRFGELSPTRVYSRRHPALRARVDVDGLNELIDAFLESNDEELTIECENNLVGYYLNKLILERGLESVISVNVEPASCKIVLSSH